LAGPISDHIPFVIHIDCIPRANFFRFENFWIHHPGFKETVELHWKNSPIYGNAARNILAKFKQVRAGLKSWSKSLSNLSKLIHNCNWVLLLLDGLEEQRALSSLESKLRSLVKAHLSSLLDSRRIFWKQRNTTRWVHLGDENTSFFYNIATISHEFHYLSIFLW
jgi:hypothetical protein